LIVFETARLIVRHWRDEDRAPFAAMNADPRVREHFPSTQTRAESDASIDRATAAIAARGFAFWAVERKDSGEFIGFTGLTVPALPMPYDEGAAPPSVEIGWRLAHAHWGCGFASEAARECLRLGFERLHLPHIVSFTTVRNVRSMAVMARIGMADTGIVFEHPGIEPGHPQRPHVLWRVDAAGWAQA
jgi:RimJ/RimL family protein N-acetyltransferase